MGSEQVAQAGRNIAGAADTMNRAVQSMDWQVERLERILNEFADRMEAIANPPPEPVITQDPPPNNWKGKTRFA